MKLLCLLLLASTAFAQESNHKFFDKPARFALSSSAAVFAADAVNTCRMLGAGGHEEWLPVHSCPGVSLWMVGNSLSQISTAYLFHRTSHHKLERIAEYVGAVGSAYGVTYTLTHFPHHDTLLIPVRKGPHFEILH